MNIRLLEGLRLNENGCLVNKYGEKIHLRQGDMDGACGPYCAAMSLLVMGEIKLADVMALNGIDYRTHVGKFLKEINALSPLVLNGTFGTQIVQMLVSHNKVIAEPSEGAPRAMIEKTRDALKNNCPVIMVIRSRKGDGLNHWVLAIGQSEDSIYLLDPGSELPSSNYWNSVMVQEDRSRFSNRYMSYRLDPLEVETNEIVVIRKKSSLANK